MSKGKETMPFIYAVSGRLSKARGGTSTVQVVGTALKKGMLVTIVTSNSKSAFNAWVGTVKKKKSAGIWLVDLVAQSKSKAIDLNDLRVAVSTPTDKLKSIQSTEELKKPLPAPQPPVPPPTPPQGGALYVPKSWVHDF